MRWGGTIIAPSATVDELSLADWQRLITFNLDGTFLFCHAVVPLMKRAKRQDREPLVHRRTRAQRLEQQHYYAAAKGVVVRPRKLAHELGPFGIAVNAIAPSLTLTTYPPALGAANGRRAGSGSRARASAALPRPRQPRDLLPRFERRRLRDRRHHRRDPADCNPEGERDGRRGTGGGCRGSGTLR